VSVPGPNGPRIVDQLTIKGVASTSFTLAIDARAPESIRPKEAPGLAFAVSATTLAVTPAEATPDSASAVLRHSQGQITREAAAPRLTLS
jgi:hypothetical protein